MRPGKDVASLNDVWGWTDPQTGVEYALVRRHDGLPIVDLSTPVEPRPIAFPPSAISHTIWRDMKVYADHVYVVRIPPGHNPRAMSAPASPFSLEGMDVVVIGGASGIGEASARLAARSGARVAVADRDEAAAEQVVTEIGAAGGAAVSRDVDIRSGESVEALFRGLESDGFQPRGLVSTPGVNVRKRLADTSEEEFERVVSLNLKGTFHALRHGAASLARSGGGSIVLLSSIRSQVVEPGQGVYAATKAGIVQLARTAAAEWAPSGVRVNALAPGVVETPLTAPIENRPDWKQAYTDKTLLGRWATAEEMAAPTVFLLSRAASYVTGSVLFADGGWTAVDGRFDPL